MKSNLEKQYWIKRKKRFQLLCITGFRLATALLFSWMLLIGVANSQSLIDSEQAKNMPMSQEQQGESATDESTNTINDEWQDQLVQDVLEQDIRQALRNSNNKDSGALAPAQSILAPRLVALYGVGKALMAEVQVGNQAYLYIRGQTYPAGYLGDKRVYQLKAMNGACIQLEKAQDKHSLCLRMLLGEAMS